MILTGQYLINRDGFKVEVQNPEITVIQTVDNIKEKTLSDVWVRFVCETCRFDIPLQGFTYEETWEDSDVYDWALKELETFKIKEDGKR